MMPYKDKEKQKEASRLSAAKSRARRQEIVNAVKSAGCAVCGESEFVCLDMHHLDPIAKEYAVSRLVNGKATIELILEELAKCVVLCSNCHRKLHAGLLTL